MKIPKLPSNRYMRTFNWHREQMGHAPMSKRQFVWVLSILTRRQQRDILHQLEDASAIPDKQGGGVG